MIMSMLASKQVPIDRNNVPLASLVAQEEKVDVNFFKITSTTMLIGTTLVIIIINLILQIMAILMEIMMVTFLVI